MPGTETSNPAGAVTVIPALMEEPDTLNVRVAEAVPKVVVRPKSVPEPAVIVEVALTVLEAMDLVCWTAPGLFKVMLPL